MAIGAFETRRQQLADEGGVEAQRGAGYDANAGSSRRRVTDMLAGGQDSLNEWTRSAVDAGMPQFNQALQGVRESAIQRGVGLGTLGTSYEGDLASAFERNITNAVSSQAMNLYNTRTSAAENMYNTDANLAENSRNRQLDLESGQVDRDTARQNEQNKRRGGLFGAIGGVIGGVGGFMVGGPAGAAAGAQLGSGLGQGIGG